MEGRPSKVDVTIIPQNLPVGSHILQNRGWCSSIQRLGVPRNETPSSRPSPANVSAQHAEKKTIPGKKATTNKAKKMAGDVTATIAAAPSTNQIVTMVPSASTSNIQIQFSNPFTGHQRPPVIPVVYKSAVGKGGTSKIIQTNQVASLIPQQISNQLKQTGVIPENNVLLMLTKVGDTPAVNTRPVFTNSHSTSKSSPKQVSLIRQDLQHKVAILQQQGLKGSVTAVQSVNTNQKVSSAVSPTIQTVTSTNTSPNIRFVSSNPPDAQNTIDVVSTKTPSKIMRITPMGRLKEVFVDTKNFTSHVTSDTKMSENDKTIQFVLPSEDGPQPERSNTKTVMVDIPPVTTPVVVTTPTNDESQSPLIMHEKVSDVSDRTDSHASQLPVYEIQQATQDQETCKSAVAIEDVVASSFDNKQAGKLRVISNQNLQTSKKMNYDLSRSIIIQNISNKSVLKPLRPILQDVPVPVTEICTSLIESRNSAPHQSVKSSKQMGAVLGNIEMQNKTHPGMPSSVTLPLVLPVSDGKIPDIGKGKYTPVLCRIQKGSSAKTSDAGVKSVGSMPHVEVTSTSPEDISIQLIEENSLKPEIERILNTKSDVIVKKAKTSMKKESRAAKVVKKPLSSPKLAVQASGPTSGPTSGLTSGQTSGLVSGWKIMGGNVTKHAIQKNPFLQNKPKATVERVISIFQSLPICDHETDDQKRQKEGISLKDLLMESEDKEDDEEKSKSQLSVCPTPDKTDMAFVQKMYKQKIDFMNNTIGKTCNIAYAYDSMGQAFAPHVLLGHENECEEYCISVECEEDEADLSALDSQSTGSRVDHVSIICSSMLQMVDGADIVLNPSDAKELKKRQKDEELQKTINDLIPEEMEQDGDQTNIPEEMEQNDDQTNIPEGKEHNDDPNIDHGSKEIAEDSSMDVPVDPGTMQVEALDKANDDHDLQIERSALSSNQYIGSSMNNIGCHEGIKALMSEADCFDGSAVDIETVEEVPAFDILDGVPFINGVEVDVETQTRDTIYGFGCYLCSFASLSEESLIEHWKAVHVPAKPYICIICKKAAFSSSISLLNHVKKFHTMASDCLPICVRGSTMYKNNLVMYVSANDGMSDRVSSYMRGGIRATIVDDVIDKYQSKDELEIYCGTCNFSCKSTMAMRAHQNEVHPRSYCFTCPQCKKTFQCRFDLLRHKQLKHSQSVDDESVGFRRDKPSTQTIVRVAGCSKMWMEACSQDLKCSGSYICRLCRRAIETTECATAKQMWQHLTLYHNWPSSVHCEMCSMEIVVLECERKARSTCCPSCFHSISLVPIIVEDNLPNQPVFICNICDYKTLDKSSMYRHIKYSYTNHRPYLCPYCPYGSVEKPKVKKHVISSHNDKKPLVRIHVDGIVNMKLMLDKLMKKIAIQVEFNDLEAYLGEDPDIYSDSGHLTYRKPVNPYERARESYLASRPNNRGPQYQCEDCDFLAMSWPTYCRHRRQAHLDGAAPLIETTRTSSQGKPPAYAHFKCGMCGYFCIDRSSMTRHIKYMHMHERPHSCPYCGYKNVEKTKVRIHVTMTHPSKPAYVNTDGILLKRMSESVKGFYKKVNFNKNGKPLPEPTSRRPGEHPIRRPRKRRKIIRKIIRKSSNVQPVHLVRNAHTMQDRAYWPGDMDSDGDFEQGKTVQVKEEPLSDNVRGGGQVQRDYSDEEDSDLGPEDEEDEEDEEEDEEDDRGDVDWAVETIDDDVESEDSEYEVSDPEEFSEMQASTLDSPAVGQKRKRRDTEVERYGFYENVQVTVDALYDAKLHMKPVVSLKRLH